MNGDDTVNAVKVEQTAETLSRSSCAEPDCDIVSDNDTTLDNCQYNASELIYSLCIDSQTLLWKAMPKPSNTSQVCDYYYLHQAGYFVIGICSECSPLAHIQAHRCMSHSVMVMFHSALAHKARDTVQYLKQATPQVTSPDLNPVDYSICSIVSTVCLPC